MEHKSQAAPLLSVVIATRNRIPYAISAIESILGVSDARLELAVQDNSESDGLESYIHDRVSDGRLRYRHTRTPLSFVGNFDAAVELATGEYVCAIGDDDGVNPEILEAAAWAKSNDVDCLALRMTVSFLWPGTEVPSTMFARGNGGCLTVWDIRGFTREANVDKEMRRLVQNGAASYLEFDLPKLYHGLVHRRCLMAVRDKSGAYFGGLSPDIFASVALGCVARRVVVTDYPLTIPGACGASGSVVEGALGTHSRRLEDAPHFRHRGPYQWSEHVPRVYTVQTLWADSALAALRAMDRADLVSQLNYSRLAAHCIAANLDVARPVVSDLLESMRGRRENRLSGLIRLAISFVTGPGSKFAARVWNRLMMIVGWRSVHRIDGLTSMSEVSHALVRYLDRKGLRFTGGACRSAGRVQVRRDACPVRSEP